MRKTLTIDDWYYNQKKTSKLKAKNKLYFKSNKVGANIRLHGGTVGKIYRDGKDSDGFYRFYSRKKDCNSLIDVSNIKDVISYF